MKTLVAGHTYSVPTFVNKEEVIIHFVHKEPKDGTTDSELICDGITSENLLEILIDRLQFLQTKFPCRENSIVITKLEESLMWLNKRTADRIKRNVEGKQEL